jgi:uncharacterized protein (DUF608 family)
MKEQETMPHHQPSPPPCANPADLLATRGQHPVPPAAEGDACWIDVSHGVGIPFGAIGTGYLVFGKYGFVKVNFNSFPDRESLAYNGRGPDEACNYLCEPANKAPFALFLTEEGRTVALQETPVAWQPSATPVSRVTAHAFLPRGHFAFENAGEGLTVAMTGFSPMIPHDLASSTIPVLVLDVTLTNTTSRPRQLTVRLGHRDPLQAQGDSARFEEPAGQVAFRIPGGHADPAGVATAVHLGAGESRSVRLFIAWHYPQFNTPSPAATDSYQRFYAKRFADAAAVLACASIHADTWAEAIDAWHDAYDLPAEFKRLWFSSLTSVITSTLLSDDPYFFEIETPHFWVCTMDVNVYSSWLYLINWPEIERMEMNQYLQAIPAEGENRGFVWHSLWSDACHYVEEPVFLTRLYRDHLWFNDPAWLQRALPVAVAAAEYVYRTASVDDLITSRDGNQSYDCWKMPGISAFVNSAWVYGLRALERMARAAGHTVTIGGRPLGELAASAVEHYDARLWNEETGCWNCFSRTPDAAAGGVPETLFSDQLFGKWVVTIAADLPSVLPEDKIRTALTTLYRHNLIDDPERGFRGWVNGLRPGRVIDRSGYHAFVFWIGGQLNLGSLLGEAGNEAAALDVFRSVEASLHNNHLAVGEWNQSINDALKTGILPDEPAKDTPRFPPYPRYKCAWEYVVRLLGMKMDSTHLHLAPFKTLAFSFKDITLAGVRLTVVVEADWTAATLDGVSVVAPVKIPRGTRNCTVEFRLRMPS